MRLDKNLEVQMKEKVHISCLLMQSEQLKVHILKNQRMKLVYQLGQSQRETHLHTSRSLKAKLTRPQII